MSTGETFATWDGRIDADAVYAYARATNETSELALDGVAVPPLFTAMNVAPLWEGYQELEDVRDYVRIPGVHGQHDVHLHHPVRPGATLTWTAALHSLSQTSAGARITLHIAVSDQARTVLVEHYWTNLIPGATITNAGGQALHDHTLDSILRAQPAASTTIFVERDQAYRYAGVSFDHASHAIDEEEAHVQGYPTKILQGMCTFGLCSAALVDLVAGGDGRRVKRLAGRFASPAFPSRDLTIQTYAAGDSDGRRSVAFEALQDGVPVVRHGRIEFVAD